MTEGDYAEPLLIELIARRLQFDRLAAALPGDPYPPYLLVAVGLFIEHGVFDVYNYFVAGKSTPLDDPGSLGIGVGVAFAVVAVKRLEEARQAAVEDLHKLDYDDTTSDTEDKLFSPIQTTQQWLWQASERTETDGGDTTSEGRSAVIDRVQRGVRLSWVVQQLRQRVRSPPNPSRTATAPLTPTVPLRYKFTSYLLGLVMSFYNAFVFIGWERLVEIQGFLVGIVGLLLFPLMYIPLIVDVTVLCLGVSLFVPRQIVRADPDLIYHSPWEFGGFRSVGKALRRSYFLYVVGFSLYTGLLYLRFFTPAPTPYPPPSTFIDLLFTGLGIAGALAIGYSVYRIHTFMKRKREQRLDELKSKVRQRIESPVDTYGASTAGLESWETLQTKIEQVKNTRTYPFTPAASLRIAVGVLLPQVLNLFRFLLTTDVVSVGL